MIKLSVVISTRNRSQRLERCLKSIKKLAGEIIVIDNESRDDTASIAKKYGAIVFERPNNLMLNVNKNYGFNKATGEWILCLDDDEEITGELVEEIEKVTNANETTVGYWIPRKNIIFGKWIRHGIWWPDPQLRLFKRGMGKFPQKHVHEYISVDGPTTQLTNAFTHYNYDSLDQYLDKMLRIYIPSEVEKFISSGYVISWQDAIRFPASDFVKLYFAQAGFKDGLHGLVLATLQAFYSFLIFVRLWERSKFLELDIPLDGAIAQLKSSGSELTYWSHTAKINETKNPIKKFSHRLLRKYEKSRNNHR
jgi:glycosyltransferase involved in cell wall biosynthesis